VGPKEELYKHAEKKTQEVWKETCI
jgi:hypothetical protein